MASPINESYTTLRLSSSFDVNRSDDQVGTADPSEHLLKQNDHALYRSDSHDMRISQAVMSQTRRLQVESMLNWVRWGIIMVMQCLIIALLLPTSGVLSEHGWAGKLMSGLGAGKDNDHCCNNQSTSLKINVTEIGGDVSGNYISTSAPKFMALKPEEDKYVPDMTTNSSRMTIRANWDMLLPLGNGAISISGSVGQSPLGEPFKNNSNTHGHLYEASWTRAIRCLYNVIDSYHQLSLLNTTNSNSNENSDHKIDTYCLEYLRNYILCTADMTLEGEHGNNNNESSHICRDRGEAIKWIEQRKVNDTRSILSF